MGEILNMVQVEGARDTEAAKALLDDLVRGHHVRVALGMEEQVRIKREMDRADVVFARGGLGERKMCVSTKLYWEMVRQYGQDCWRDGGFRKDMGRHHPEMLVKARSRKVMVQVQGRRADAPARRGVLFGADGRTVERSAA
jgi:hypothetical protein